MPSKQQGGALRRAGDVQQGGALRRAGDVQQGGALVDGGKKQSGGGKKRSAGKKGADLEQIRAETGIPFLNKKVGDKHEVWDGHALQTKGGLTVVDFLLNRTGKVVSKRKFESGGRLRETLTGTKANLALRMTGEDRLKQLQSGSRNINTGKVAASTLEKKKAGGKKKRPYRTKRRLRLPSLISPRMTVPRTRRTVSSRRRMRPLRLDMGHLVCKSTCSDLIASIAG